MVTDAGGDAAGIAAVTIGATAVSDFVTISDGWAVSDFFAVRVTVRSVVAVRDVRVAGFFVGRLVALGAVVPVGVERGVVARLRLADFLTMFNSLSDRCQYHLNAVSSVPISAVSGHRFRRDFVTLID